MNEIIPRFLAGVAAIEALKPAYRQPGDGSDGTCDCIGLIIGAVRHMGLKWKGIHGCNWAARKEISDLQPLTKASQLEKGMIVLKARQAGSANWKLPERYRAGKQYYNGDLRDYYHAGVVTSVSPLVITHMSGGGIQKSHKLSAWGFCGHLDLLLRAAGQHPAAEKTSSAKATTAGSDAAAGTAPTASSAVPAQLLPAGEAQAHSTVKPLPAAGAQARVTAPGGRFVKMRQQPSQRCRLYDEVPVGALVTIAKPGETWARIDYGRRRGWYMMARYLEILAG